MLPLAPYPCRPRSTLDSCAPSCSKTNSILATTQTLSLPVARHFRISKIFNSEQVLSLLVVCLDWPDLLALLNTCTQLRNIFRDTVLRELMLSRFVPGFADALRLRDPANYHDVPISIHDLDLLLISLKLPLHRYPTQALKILTAMCPTLENDYITTKMVALSLAHSRFVLLLQALVHSSLSPIPPEKEQFAFYKSRHTSSRHAPDTQNAPQLNFPAPLSYLKQNPNAAQLTLLPDPPVLSKRSKRHSLPTRSKSSFDPSYSHPFPQARAVLPSADSISTMISINNTYGEPHETINVVRRRSIFKKPTVTPPPPEEPRALRVYSRTWRKSTWNASRNLNQGHQTGLDDFASLYDSDECIIPPPNRRFFVPLTNASSDSSVSSSPAASSTPLPRVGFESSSSSSGGRTSPPTPPPTIPVRKSMSLFPLVGPSRSSSPHDLSLATSRVRAPILRVFVPCTEMEIDSESVLACERYLVEAGLWEHLSTGDVVCNLGYVPSAASDYTMGDSTGEDIRDGSLTGFGPSRFSVGSAPNNSSWRKWLLFNGECLMPYTAPDVLPIDNPISLPSPYYYTHIIPSGSTVGYSSSGLGSTTMLGGKGGSNIRFRIGKFPPLMMEEGLPQMAMVNVTGRVRSVKTPSGWINARKWAWTARVRRYKVKQKFSVGSLDKSHQVKWSEPASQPQMEMGEAWYGEWVLEGEGTSEGYQELLDILSKGCVPGGPREWEFVRQRSGNGRIWLRMAL